MIDHKMYLVHSFSPTLNSDQAKAVLEYFVDALKKKIKDGIAIYIALY